ncbi:hypothetical protein [Streptomyces sp. URMC 125]|uniref:hypothetical protein n=1 Tax=Streptomyces sp. URMC 125 TaxID=3423419 RepID=UPI003F1C7CC0
MTATDDHPTPVRLLSIATQREDGEDPVALCDWIAAQKPAAVLWQGLHPDTVTDVEKRLGMLAHSHDGLAVFLGDGPLLLEAVLSPFDQTPGRHPAHILARHRGDDRPTPRELNLLSVAACPWDSATRVSEARWLTRWSHPGMLTVAAGVWHDVPKSTEVPWDRVGPDSALYVQRTYASTCGHGRHTDDLADRELLAGGYVDAALHYVHWFGRGHVALAPTSAHGPDRNLMLREVRAYVTAELAAAVAGVRVEQPAGLDWPLAHWPLVIDLDPGELQRIMSR